MIAMSIDRCGRVEICPQCGGYVDVPAATAATIVDPPPVSTGRACAVNEVAWPPAWQLVVVFCLAVLPHQLSAIRSLVDPGNLSFLGIQCRLIVGSLQVTLPLLAIIHLSKADWREFGIVRPHWAWDVGFAILIWMTAEVTSLAAIAWADKWAWTKFIAPATETIPRPATALDFAVLLIGCLANGFAEELAMQGVLLTRLERCLRSTWQAILLTAVLFASYHIYQGSRSAIAITAFGLVQACSFCILRRLWPLCLAHALADVLAWTYG